MAKLTKKQKARAKRISKARGIPYPNAWANMIVARGERVKPKRKKK